MAATADPRAKAPATQTHRIKPWAPPPPPRGHHRVPSLPAVSGAATNRDRRRSATSHRHAAADAAAEEPYGAGLEDLRAKLMGHLHEAADRLRPPPAKPHRSPPEPVPPAAPQQDAAAASMPWTLRERKRRPSAAHGSTSMAASSPPATPWPTTVPATDDGGVRAPFSVALEAEEIEEDVYALTGARPRRRPRKRSRVVQRQLDSLFPGLWLTEITADAYRVADD